MTATEFRVWHSSLPEHLQAYAKSLYQSGKAHAPHTASSLDLIKQLVSSKAAAESNPILKDFLHD